MKNNKGITLIVLIITIIIMLILVAVTIDITVDNGLFNNAKKARDDTNDKVGQIQNRTNELMAKLNEVSNTEEAKIITFIIDEVEYEAEEGMTWGEWCDSEYNTGGFYVDTPGEDFERPVVCFDYEGITVVVKLCEGSSFNRWSYSTDFVCEGDDGMTCGSCFVKGTQVQCNLNGETKNIEEFKAGDTVISYDIFNDKYYEAEVVELIVHNGIDKANKLAEIVLEDGTKLTCTLGHPVYTEEGFKSINSKKYEKLQLGDSVKTINGYKKIIDINIYEVEPTIVYNLNIKDFEEIVDNDLYDTFITNNIIVHNKSAWK